MRAKIVIRSIQELLSSLQEANIKLFSKKSYEKELFQVPPQTHFLFIPQVVPPIFESLLDILEQLSTQAIWDLTIIILHSQKKCKLWFTWKINTTTPNFEVHFDHTELANIEELLLECGFRREHTEAYTVEIYQDPRHESAYTIITQAEETTLLIDAPTEEHLVESLAITGYCLDEAAILVENQ